MSITINIYYMGQGGSACAFAREMTESGIVRKIREEKGNEKYEYFYPIDDPETVLLIDRWKDQESIDRHHASEMMSKIALLREKYNLKMRVERFLSDPKMIKNI